MYRVRDKILPAENEKDKTRLLDAHVAAPPNNGTMVCTILPTNKPVLTNPPIWPCWPIIIRCVCAI